MKILVEKLSKRFQQQWIFKNLHFEFDAPGIYGIAGPNGSGKSTLMQILAGLIPPTNGNIQYVLDGQTIGEDRLYQCISYAAPYAELYEYFTIRELLNHHTRFKPFYPQWNAEGFIERCYFQGHENKWIKTLSSGMKQRLRLGLSILSQSEILFLDEPLTNLDATAIQWYHQLLDECKEQRLIIIASNDAKDFENAISTLEMSDWKAGN